MRPPRRVEVWGAAKINIGWRVGHRRPDGYHEVCGLMHTITLTDRLEIVTGEDGALPVRVVVPGHPPLEDVSNLVCVAAAALARRAQPQPTTVVVHKSIPVAAGLGGGSADAAAALVGLNAVWGTRRSPRELIAIAADVGSDVPGILHGGLVHASGRGERVRRAGAATEGWFVLGIGKETIAARDAYAALDELLPGVRRVGWHHNDLEAAASALVPELAERMEAMRGAAGVAFVSGSGPTVVGIAVDEAHAQDVAARVRNVFQEVILAQPTTWGVRLKAGNLD